MKSISKPKSNRPVDSFWMSIALLCALAIFVSIALKVSPSDIITLVENFATHHFILAVMFAFFFTLLILRSYYKSFSARKPGVFFRRQTKEVTKTNFFSRFKNKVNLHYQTLKSHFIGIHQIETLTFEDIDLLVENDLKRKRENDLNKAMKLGNSYKEKVKIYFKDEDSNRHVYTSVWHVSSTHVTLKYGTVIPVKAIYKVKF